MNHVIPLDDSRDHEISERCHCQPFVCDVVIHHAFDGREKLERHPIFPLRQSKRWGVFEEPKEAQ